VPFPKVKRPRPIGKAAAQAATAALVKKRLLDPEDVQTALTRLTSTFSYFNQPTFEERLRDLLAPVLEVAPGLIGEEDLEAWIEDVRRARNMEAHRFARKPNEREVYRRRVDDYVQLSISTEWVLRIAVLLQLKVPPKLIHARLLDHNQFAYALANLDHADDPRGSRLAEFRASRPRDTG
jgi:hypothetical protein